MAHKLFTFIPDAIIAANRAVLATTGIQIRDNTEYLKEQVDNSLPDQTAVRLFYRRNYM